LDEDILEKKGVHGELLILAGILSILGSVEFLDRTRLGELAFKCKATNDQYSRYNY
jgi:hypothetical protein